MRERDIDARPETNGVPRIDLTPPYHTAPYPLPSRRTRRHHPVLLGVACGLCGLVAGMVIGAVGKTTNATAAIAVVPPPAATRATHTTPPPTTRPPAPRVVLTKSGSGSLTTAPFTTGSSWTVAYTFDCAAFGMSGNFSVSAADNSDLNGPEINQLAAKGADTDYVYNDAGTHALSINSECDWTVRVADAG